MKKAPFTKIQVADHLIKIAEFYPPDEKEQALHDFVQAALMTQRIRLETQPAGED